MRALCVDDEALLLRKLRSCVEKSPDIDEVHSYDEPLEAIEFARDHTVDIAFLDIRMPSMTGIELARKLTELQPDMNIIFCTGHKEYALEAFDVHAAAYLIKPINGDAVIQEIERLKRKGVLPEQLLKITCFGTFSVSSGGEPVTFERKKAKELLAYLVDKRGAVITAAELCAALYEEDLDEKKARNRVYQLIYNMKYSLENAGAGKALINNQNGYAIDKRYVDCDYYRLLNGDPSAVRLFAGEYMSQYSWAESTCAWLVKKYM